MNNIVTANANLPAHLQALAQNTALMNSSLSAGISSGGHPRISIRGAKFHLVSEKGEEVHVNAMHLDVIIIDANPTISKSFYTGRYDPAAEAKTPDCFSDNGIAPSVSAKSPQCGTCAACPQNVWGSKISEASGKQIKACSDTKRIAVLIADNSAGPVFELRVPGDSLKELGTYIKTLDKHGVPASMVITRLTFDPEASYPRLLFAAGMGKDGKTPYIDAAQAADVQEVLGTAEVDDCTGKADKPRDTTLAIVAPAVAAPVALPLVTPMAPPPQPVFTAPVAPAPQFALPVMQPVFTAPVAPAPQFALPVMQPVAAPAAPEAPKRTRKRAPVEPAQASPQAAPAPQAPMPAFLQSVVPNAAAAVAPLAVPVSNSALDDMLAKAMQA